MKTKRIKLTKELLEELYPQYNEMYFGGELPAACEFHLIPKTERGAFGFYREKTDRKGRIIPRIWMSTAIAWTDELLREVLVHEMIHLYNARVEKRTWFGILGHGRCFRRKARKITRQHGLKFRRFKTSEYTDGTTHTPKWWEIVISLLVDW